MTTTDYTRQTRSDYAERLDALGVDYPGQATKRDLYELLMRTLRDEIENITGNGEETTGEEEGRPLRLADAADARREVAERMRPKPEPEPEPEPPTESAMSGERPGEIVAVPVAEVATSLPTVGRWEQMKAMAVELAASRLLRPTLQGRWEDVLLILLTGHDLGISSTMALSKIHVIEGVPSAGAELQLALVRRAGHRVTGDVDADLRWASISGTRADTGETMNVVYKLDEAVAAGRCTITAEGKVRSRSASGKVKPWEASTSDMLWARAVTRLCRRHFGDVIGGLSYTPEELGVIDVEGEEVAPVVDHTPLREDCNGAQDGSEHDDDGLCCKVRIAERVQALPDEARAKLRAAWAEETKRGNMPTLKGMDRGAVARAGALIEAAEREALPAQAEVVDRPSDPAEVEHEEADVVEPEGAS